MRANVGTGLSGPGAQAASNGFVRPTQVPTKSAVVLFKTINSSTGAVAAPEGCGARRLRTVGPRAQIRRAGYLLKMACTEALAPIVRLHTGTVPLQAPPQPTKLLPAGAVAVSVTAVLCA